MQKKLTVDILYIWILILLKEERKYAYELRQEIKTRFSFAPAMVTSYHVLYKLEREGFVNSIKQVLTPNRKYYEITPKGIKLIDETKKNLRKMYELLFDEEF